MAIEQGAGKLVAGAAFSVGGMFILAIHPNRIRQLLYLWRQRRGERGADTDGHGPRGRADAGP